MAPDAKRWKMLDSSSHLMPSRGDKIISVFVCEFRLGSAPPDRTPYLSRMSALEQSIHKFAQEPSKSVMRPELGLTFDPIW